MKRYFPALVLVAVFAFSAFAENLRVVVAPLKDTTGVHGALAAELTETIRDEVQRAGYIVVPEYTFFTNWWRVAAAAWDKDVPVPAPEKYEAKKRSGGFSMRDLFDHDLLGTMIGAKDTSGLERLGVDIAVIGEIRGSDKGAEIYAEILNIGSGRYCSAVRQAETGREKDALKDEIRSLLGKAGVIRRPEADEEVDNEYSKVAYRVKTTTGGIITIQVDYASDRPDPPVQQVDILPPPDLKEGVRSYRVPTREKEDLVVEFHMQDNEVASVLVDRALPPDTPGLGRQGTLTVTSDAGYEITFTFSGDNDTEMAVQCAPSRNPYSCGQAGKG